MVVDRLVSFTVEYVEEASEKTAKSWSKCVRIQIVEQVVLLAQQHNWVWDKSDANSGVEAGSESIGARNTAEESGNNAHGGTDTLAVSGSVLTLDHQDNADKDEGACDLVDDDVQVHRIL